ncbi:MAG: M20/M25/M40 family metallo-hydrolase [Candidatus Thalassarchaeaceae archaeon]|jgi:hypothetical protein|nr:hypothetical protein [Euryarchaeota archaeon]MDP6870721.1 M20/M25/M40 family metallo-hydrolase [Candidatus Thalassarchaeaceae archaeon]
MRRIAAIGFALVIFSGTLQGCLTSDADAPLIPAEDLEVSPGTLVGAQLQEVEIIASRSMSVHIPYLIIDTASGFVVNGTTLHFSGSGVQSVEMIAPSNIDSAYFLLGQEGRIEWPLRETNQSWEEWFYSPEFNDSPYTHVQVPVARENRSGYSPEEGSLHGTGIIDGLNAFVWLEEFADPDSGYNQRWGPFTLNDPTYMRAANFMQGELQGMGYDSQVHRYWISDFSYAVNVCGYKEGTMFPDEWLVLGAHLDIAEPGSPPGGGAQIGAHDNGAGVALVLEAARGLAQFDHRRTIVVCFWSNEENGYDGVDRWIDNIPAGVTLSNYLNADAVGTNWPGYYTLVVDIIPETDNQLNEQWPMIRLAEWIGSNNNNISEALRLGREIYHTEGYASMKDVDSSDQKRLSISVHESQRGRSDYERIADQLGVVSMDFGSLTGGSDCYHGPCDNLETMIDMMVTDNGTGVQNLVESFDLISWWLFNLAMHLDESPIYDES